MLDKYFYSLELSQYYVVRGYKLRREEPCAYLKYRFVDLRYDNITSKQQITVLLISKTNKVLD